MGGKSHEFIVLLSGVFPRPPGIFRNGVAIHADQTAGLADAASLGDMSQDGVDFFLRHPRSKGNCPFAFGKTGLASPAAKQATLLVWPVTVAHAQVFPAPFPVIRTLAILTAKT